MERPDTHPRLERARAHLTDIREQVNAYCDSVPADLGIADSDFRVAAIDAQVQVVNAPAASLVSDIYALEARVLGLQRGS